METSKLKEVIVPIITPWHESKFDKNSYIRIGDNIFDGGADGLLVLGATAELPKLTFETKMEVIDTAANVFGGFGKKLLVCTNGNTLEETCNLSLHAAGKRKIDALVIAPMYQLYGESVGYKSPVEYVTEIIDALESSKGTLPYIILYNNPKLTGKDIPPEDIKALAREPRIKGIKDSSGNFEYFSWLMALQSITFSVFQGDERLIKQSLEIGADGIVCGSGNIYPRFMIDNIFAKRDETAFRILEDIIENYKKGGDAIKVIKEIAYKEGLIASPELVSY